MKSNKDFEDLTIMQLVKECVGVSHSYLSVKQEGQENREADRSIQIQTSASFGTFVVNLVQ